jgi:peptidoglycan/xylan/chitin deacetylase (PgdA/CDA1 family)
MSDSARRAPVRDGLGFAWPEGARAAAAFTFDVDAESAILSSHPQAAGWLDVMTHQAYGPRTGVPRILRMLKRRSIRATFFVPGYTAERWPDVLRQIRDEGHEVGHHGYLHESSRKVDGRTEEIRLLRGLDALEKVAGVRPTGYRAPMWEVSNELPDILARNGFRYDSSLMDADVPYRLASTSAHDAASVIELPVHWSLDDWEPYAYLPGITGSGVISHPDEVTSRWHAELEALSADGGLFMLTNHPFLTGRASRTVALERLIGSAQELDGVWIATCDEIARHAETLRLPAMAHLVHQMPTEQDVSAP